MIRKMQLFVYLIIITFLLSNINCKFSKEQVQHLSEELSKRFQTLFSDITHYKKLQTKYEQAYKTGIFKIEKINIADVSKKFNKNLQEVLLSKIESIQRIKKNAENLYMNYTKDNNIKPYNYYNSKQKNPNQPESTFFLNLNVSLNNSFVQLPTNIYESHKDILNEAKWSQGLDESFRINFNSTPTLLWQYFCSETGIIRSYPGVNNDPTVLDLYDCRRRLWYSQAINSPKDVIILLDLSGSMTGSHFTIAKIAVKSLINTLQQDDFINVLTFRENVDYLISCMQNLTQATSRHKELYRNAVDSLSNPYGISNIKKAFRIAFNVFKRSLSSSLSSSSCTKVILLISDGIENDNSIHEELEELNNNNEVIIFSYIIGVSKHKEEMKRIACRNGGYYYEMPTVGNVWNRVLKYQGRLSKPLVENNNSVVIFTPLYLDSSGLGMMTTISVGVFSKENQVSKRKLLGVAGIDIRITLLEQQYPIFRMGVFGHGFAINNNGMVLIHPRFRGQQGYLPDPETLYLNEIEHTVDSLKIQQITISMIDSKIDCENAELDMLYFQPNNKRSVRFNTTYCYHPTNHTPFSTGLSIPLKNQNILKVTGISNEMITEGIKGLATNHEKEMIKIANWIYCDIPAEAQKTQPASKKLYPTVAELFKYLTDQNTNKIQNICVNETLLPLLIDSQIISQFKESFWRLDPEGSFDNIYILTASGYITSMYHYNAPIIGRDVLSEGRFTHPSAFYIKDINDMIIFTTKINVGRPNYNNKQDDDSVISIGKVITLSDQNILTAIIGMDFPVSHMKEILKETSKLFDFDCYGGECISYHCDYIDNISCYLLDEHGYIITGNQHDSEQGYFFGYVNGHLMYRMEELDIYTTKKYKDTQAECFEPSHGNKSGSNKLYSLVVNITNILIIIVNQITTYIYIFISLLMPSTNKVNTQSVNGKNESCTKEISIHTLNNHSLTYTEDYPFIHNCNISFIVQTINNTNLLLLMFNNNCIEDNINIEYTNKPTRIHDIHGICLEHRHYRKGLPLCYRLISEDVICNGTICFIFKWRYLIITLFLVWFCLLINS